jgi:hypothetical protein
MQSILELGTAPVIDNYNVCDEASCINTDINIHVIMNILIVVIEDI